LPLPIVSDSKQDIERERIHDQVSQRVAPLETFFVGTVGFGGKGIAAALRRLDAKAIRTI
jgi:hypothetical protein